LPLQQYLKTHSSGDDGKVNPELGILLYIAGGSYFRTSALLDCVHHHMRSLDWHILHSLDSKVTSAWDTVPAVLFHLSGYKTVYWSSVCSRPLLYLRHYQKKCSSATILHKTEGNPAKAMYITRKDERQAYEGVFSYEDLFSLDLSLYKRKILK
jgi:hypothetical protein